MPILRILQTVVMCGAEFIREMAAVSVLCSAAALVRQTIGMSDNTAECAIKSKIYIFYSQLEI